MSKNNVAKSHASLPANVPPPHSVLGGSENHIGADGDPKSVVADKRDLNEHANNCESHKNKRNRKSEVHNAAPWRCHRTSDQRFSDRAFM
jgi:hypothetical protein